MENLEQPKDALLAQGEDSSQVDMGEITSTQGSDTEGENPSKYGKFKDVESLLSAYNSLQSDYTKKCQALSSLSKTIKEQSAMQVENSQNDEQTQSKSGLDYSTLTKEEKEKMLEDYIFSSPELKDKFLAKYFEELNLPKAPRLISKDKGSGFVLCEREKPKTLEEAGNLVRNILNQNN